MRFSIWSGSVGVHLSTTWKSLMIENVFPGEMSAMRATSSGVTSCFSILMMSLRPSLRLSRLSPMVTAPSNLMPSTESTLSAVPATRWSITVPSRRADTLICGSERSAPGRSGEARSGARSGALRSLTRHPEQHAQHGLAHRDAVARLVEVRRARVVVEVAADLREARQRVHHGHVLADAFDARAVDAVGVLDLLVLHRVGEALLLDARGVE